MSKLTLLSVKRVQDLGRHLLAEGSDDRYWLVDKKGEDNEPRHVVYLPELMTDAIH